MSRVASKVKDSCLSRSCIIFTGFCTENICQLDYGKIFAVDLPESCWKAGLICASATSMSVIMKCMFEDYTLFGRITFIFLYGHLSLDVFHGVIFLNRFEGFKKLGIFGWPLSQKKRFQNFFIDWLKSTEEKLIMDPVFDTLRLFLSGFTLYQFLNLIGISLLSPRMSSMAVLAPSIILLVILSVRQGSASVFFLTLK